MCVYMSQVEPARRAYDILGVQSVITGRRATQGGDRAHLKPLEIDTTGLLKLNPLFAWSFDLVKLYIDINEVPRNKLLDQGYRSIGDWHSTVKVGDGQGERDGRWAGTSKTECGLHKDYFQIKALAKVWRLIPSSVENAYDLGIQAALPVQNNEASADDSVTITVTVDVVPQPLTSNTNHKMATLVPSESTTAPVEIAAAEPAHGTC